MIWRKKNSPFRLISTKKKRIWNLLQFEKIITWIYWTKYFFKSRRPVKIAILSRLVWVKADGVKQINSCFQYKEKRKHNVANQTLWVAHENSDNLSFWNYSQANQVPFVDTSLLPFFIFIFVLSKPSIEINTIWDQVIKKDKVEAAAVITKEKRFSECNQPW